MPVTVLLAEPDTPTRVGIRLALEAAGIEVCCEPLDAGAAAADAWTHRPRVCLIDDALSGGALVAIDAINRRLPEVKLLLLTESEEPRNLLSAIRAGASGYIRKDLDPTRIPATIHGVLHGEAALSRTMTMTLIEALRRRDRGRSAPTTPGGPSMTDRELEVLELMTEGLRTSEIAERLAISEVTVRRHVSAAVSKLGVADRSAAIAVLSGRSRI
jgi:DNA-binding NarL/FixJ family response regulator